MWLERVSGGGVDLIDLADAKTHLRVLGDDFDAEIQQAISSASAHLDVDEDGFGGLGFPLVAQQWDLKLCRFGAALRLPFGRVTALHEIRYFQPDGIEQLADAGTYRIVREGRVFLVGCAPGSSWPTTQARKDAVTVRFTSGWATAADVPQDIKQCARLLVGHFFRNKEATAGRDVPQQMQLGIDALTRRYRGFAI
ncbi:hypothetical protein O4H48_14030 [Rhodobacteraceae bacterium G21628-S1]|nr:hypothetical protein [Rhodobacteraceae bacterium G21628-S1]